MDSRSRLVVLAGLASLAVGCGSGTAETDAGLAAQLIVDALPDTVFGRFFVATAHANGLLLKDATLTVDAATPAQQTVTSTVCQGVTQPGTFYWCTASAPGFVGSATWILYGPKALGNGPHTVQFDVSDANGEHTSVQRRFVTYVPDIEYGATMLDAGTAADASALDINASGVVVGWVQNGLSSYAAMWSPNGALTVLDTAGSQALAVNDSGDVAGVSNNKAVLWSHGARQEAPGFGSATAINNLGLVGITRGHTSISFWQNGGTVTDLGACFLATVPMRLCSVSGLNDRGQAVGAALSPHGNEIVGGYQIDIAFPSPPASVTPFANASSIVLNNPGQYAGSVSSARSALFYGGDGKPPRLLAAEFGLGAVDNNPNVRDLNDANELLVFERTSQTAYLLREGRVSRVHVSDADIAIDDVAALSAVGTIVGHGTNKRTGRAGAVVLTRR